MILSFIQVSQAVVHDRNDNGLVIGNELGVSGGQVQRKLNQNFNDNFFKFEFRKFFGLANALPVIELEVLVLGVGVVQGLFEHKEPEFEGVGVHVGTNFHKVGNVEDLKDFFEDRDALVVHLHDQVFAQVLQVGEDLDGEVEKDFALFLDFVLVGFENYQIYLNGFVEIYQRIGRF